LEPLEAGREPTHAVHLVEGTVALLDGGGVSLLRVDLSGPFSDPSATISPAQADQREELSIDAPGRWHGVGDSLVADVDGARFDLPSARFRDVRVELTSSGAVELLLTPDAATPRAIAIDGGRATFGDCSVAVDGALITELLDGELRLESGGQSQSCGLGVGGRVGVAVRAAAGSGVRRLAITRL
ncbi:MAG: hypothetical protein KC458_08415, partial [Dehalococcoidia bacterium]|nr:hypothetical protein [Dehalococcoidia bacterium]